MSREYPDSREDYFLKEEINDQNPSLTYVGNVWKEDIDCPDEPLQKESAIFKILSRGQVE